MDYWIRGAERIDTVGSDSGSDSDSGSGSGSDSGSGSADNKDIQSSMRTRSKRLYRPKSERQKLEKQLFKWRLKIRKEDPSTMLFPLDDILHATSITHLARFKPGEPETSSPECISAFIEESDEWGSIYAREVYDIISGFNSMTIQTKKPKRSLPQHAFMSVLDFGTQRAKKRRTGQDSEPSGSRVPLSELSVNTNVSLFV